MTADIPRIIITAGKSGAGKTMITCGILEALKRRGLAVTAYKCGPDYIDPMFHREVIGIPSYNLDTFLCGRESVRESFIQHGMPDAKIYGQQMDGRPAGGHRADRQIADGKGLAGCIAVIEGVMGYYDGLGGVSLAASTYDVADTVKSPAVLIVDGKGASVSAAAHIQGFLRYKNENAENSYIEGVILNRISPAMYGRMKMLIEREAKVRVYGYVPEIRETGLKSRYLGLKLPGEVKALKEKIGRLGDILEESLDLNGLIALAASAAPLKLCENGKVLRQETLRIGVASDEAFCFIYPDNLEILAGLGAKIVPFSPLQDEKIPRALDGIIFYGGYPELHAGKLAGNRQMRNQVREAVLKGLPCIAECGGFMYLTESIRDEKGNVYPMCNALPGESFYTPSLRRFGYLTLRGGKVFGKEAEDIAAHEFHYYDSRQCGEAFEAKKPFSDRRWRSMVSTDTMLAGYPHIHFAGNPVVAEAFIAACREYQKKRRQR